MKLDKLIGLTFFLMVATVQVYGQEVVDYYVHILTKAEAETTGVQIGCTCYKNIEWRPGGTTIDGLALDKRTEPSPLVKPRQTEVYELCEVVGSIRYLRERHTVVVIDLQISVQETNALNVMSGRVITLVGDLGNVGSVMDDLSRASLIQDWTLNGKTASSPTVVIKKTMSSLSHIIAEVMTKNENNNLIDIWNYSFMVNLKGLNCSGSYNRSISSKPQIVNVYKLWITKFRDKESQKDWKVVVGKDIEVGANSSPDCNNFVWEMPDMKINSSDKVWNLENDVNNLYFKIPFTDLQQVRQSSAVARVKNNDFGETNGTVKVSCKDGIGNKYLLYSRVPRNVIAANGSLLMKPEQAAKVYFQRDVDLLGKKTLQQVGIENNANKPLWFIFWKEGDVVDLLYNVEYKNDARHYGLTDNITTQVYVYARTVNHGDNETYTVSEEGCTGGRQPRAKMTFGSVGTHAQGLIGTIIHENYHKKVYLTDGWAMGTSYIHTDIDLIPDVEEDDPGRLSNPERLVFPCSYKNLPDTYDLETLFDERIYGQVGDQELRCRILQYNITNSETTWTAHYLKAKDWSAVKENLNW